MSDTVLQIDREIDEFGSVGPVQEYLLAGYYKWAGRRYRRSNASERAFALSLGVKPSTWSNWMTRGGKPDFFNCVVLSQSPFYGPEIFDICGYPRVVVVDERIKLILQNWSEIDADNQEAFINELRRAAGTGDQAGGDME